MLTSTERSARTRIRVTRGEGLARCRVRSAVTLSDSTAASIRPMLVDHDREGARVSLVPEGALLLAGDAIEIDVTVDAGARLDLIEPGGTVAFDMRGGAASWSVLVTLGPGAVLTWAGEPFVVSAGADVERRTVARLAPGASMLLRETLVLGRYGELPGAVRQRTEVTVDRLPLLIEDLPLDPTTTPALLGGHRVLSSVLAVGGTGPAEGPAEDRYDLDGGGTLWRRLGVHAHETGLVAAWAAGS
ncbi:urease accessory protein UreD [Nocardioides sp. WS12]|uniref:urease accessory protein UreD n=1 Tax=Nocardioides sp. WS12 TaxID=2486272 RepID=UPI0015F7CD29|nr:urease accessory protein UreD [Nocardioides sp. WS12]